MMAPSPWRDELNLEQEYTDGDKVVSSVTVIGSLLGFAVLIIIIVYEGSSVYNPISLSS
jgi:hypothetical protein